MDKRQYKRHPASLSGRLHTKEADETPVECDILDLSTGGAKVKPKTLVAPETLAALQLGELGPFDIAVVWSRDGRLGLKFLDDPETLADAIIAVALCL